MTHGWLHLIKDLGQFLRCIKIDMPSHVIFIYREGYTEIKTTFYKKINKNHKNNAFQINGFKLIGKSMHVSKKRYWPAMMLTRKILFHRCMKPIHIYLILNTPQFINCQKKTMDVLIAIYAGFYRKIVNYFVLHSTYYMLFHHSKYHWSIATWPRHDNIALT